PRDSYVSNPSSFDPRQSYRRDARIAGLSDARGVGNARVDMDRLAPSPFGLAGQVPPHLLGLWRDRPLATSLGTGEYPGQRRQGGAGGPAGPREAGDRPQTGALPALADRPGLDARFRANVPAGAGPEESLARLALQRLGQVFGLEERQRDSQPNRRGNEASL